MFLRFCFGVIWKSVRVSVLKGSCSMCMWMSGSVPWLDSIEALFLHVLEISMRLSSPIACRGLDVFAVEPIPSDDPILKAGELSCWMSLKSAGEAAESAVVVDSYSKNM